MMQEIDLQAVVEAYLQAYDQRDLSQCMDLFAEDAMINFASGVYRGRQAIEEWHKERFAADLRITRIDEVRTQDDTVIVDAVATSKVLKVWRFKSIAGTATFVFQQGKIKKVKFGLRTTIPLETW